MKNLTFKLLGASLATLITVESAHGVTPELVNKGQEKSNWCWNACTEMILDWRGFERDQSPIAAWAIGGINQGNFLDTGTAGLGPYFDPTTGKIFFRKGMKQVLENFGPVSSERIRRSLTWDEVQYELGANRPFVYAVYWTDAKGTVFGGHVGVAKDFQSAGRLVSIEDPWPMDSAPRPSHPGVSAVVSHDVITGISGTTYSKAVFGSGFFNNRWAETLVLGRKADVVLLIDSTGSMGGDIANVKAQALVLLDDLKIKFNDIRVAVVDYKDDPRDGSGGDPGDYILKVRQPLSADMTAARAGIDALGASGGGDGPESLYSAVYEVAKGTATDNAAVAMGMWRTGDVSRNIILMGDAPGHKESTSGGENWTGGKSLADCVKLLQDPATRVKVHALHVRDDAAALSDFKALADASGGRAAENIAATDVSSVISGFFGEIALGRYPVTKSRSMYPKFTFNVPGGGGGGAPKIKTVAVTVDRYVGPLEGELNPKNWRTFARLNVPTTELNEFQSKTYFAPGRYRWRLAGTSAESVDVLPKEVKAPVASDKVSAFVEEGYTVFDRAAAAPGDVVKVSDELQKPKVTRQQLQFISEPSALSFAIQLEDVVSKRRTTVIVSRASAKAVASAAAGTLSATVPCVANREFKWKIQGLNADRPSVDPTKWK